MELHGASEAQQNPLEISVTREDFAGSGWEEIVAECEQRLCSSYDGRFLSHAEGAQQNRDMQKYAALWLLSFITRQVLRPENSAEPFATGGFILAGIQLPGLEDIPDNQLDALKQWLPDVTDHELRARVADVVWVAHPRRDFKVAGTAIDAYVASATKLEDPVQWPYCADRLERALRLAAMAGGGAKADQRAVCLGHIAH